MEVPMKYVSYTGQDERDRTAFGFVMNDVDTQQYICHLLKCKLKEVCACVRACVCVCVFRKKISES